MRVALEERLPVTDFFRSSIILSLTLVLLHPLARAVNPDRKMSQYAHTAWRLQDGFLGSTVQAVAQTTDGYVWVGTLSGIQRFDGIHFTPWVPPGGEKLKTAYVVSLLGTSDGSLWIGTYRTGLWRWKDRQLKQYVAGDSFSIKSIVEKDKDAVWFARFSPDHRSGGICEARSSAIHCYGETEGIPSACCWSIAKDNDGSLWIAGEYEALRWKAQSESRVVFTTPHPVLHTMNLDGIAVSSDGDAWIGSWNVGKGKGLQHFSAGTWGPVKATGWDSSNIGTVALLVDRHQVLWVGTVDQGLYRISSGRIDHFGSANGLSSDSVNKVFEDHEGNIWISTQKGLDCFMDVAVSNFSKQEGLSTDEVDSVLTSKDGTLWVGGDRSLDAIRDGKITSLKTGKGLPGVQVTSLFEDLDGHLIVGVDSTLSVLKDGRFTPINRSNGKPLGFVVGIAGEKQHNIWAEVSGTPRELVQLDHLRVGKTFYAPQMPAARKLAVDAHGSIWLGLMNGDLARYRQEKIDTFHFPHTEDSPVEKVGVNEDGSVLGATRFGLIGWREGNQRIMTTLNGLPCDSVNTFIRDTHNSLWLYMTCGLVQIPSRELDRWWVNPGSKLKMRTFDTIDGVQPGLSPFEGAARTPDGKLWFANESVLQMIDPDHLLTNAVPPPVHVEEIAAGGKTYTTGSSLTLPALTSDVAIRYTALSFVAPRKVLFRYMLEGQDKTWQDADVRREAFYTNLAPRSYTFRVIACNNDGLWNTVGDTFSFAIAPRYYQTKWFSLLVACAVLGLLSSLYFLRLRQARLQVVQRLGAQLEERERIARELHDTLLQGFQGLMLRFQAVVNVLPKDGQAQRVLEAALDRADEVLFEGRQSVRNLRDEWISGDDLLDSLVRSGEEFGLNSQTNFSLAVVGTSRSLAQTVCRDAYGIGREAIANAFQHASAAKIEVEITFSHTFVRLRVRDDGKGVDQTLLDRGRDGHWGLPGMRERARKISGKLKMWSSIGAGTEIELEIPARIAYAREVKMYRWFRKHNSTSEKV